MLYAHAVRSYVFAALLARHDRMHVDDELLYVGCVLHDIGLTPDYEQPVAPFEQVSADIAVGLSAQFGWPSERREALADAIALHIAAEVGADESPEARALEAISVEGNFTLNDAFWSSQIAGMAERRYRSETASWFRQAGIDADQHAVALAVRWLAHQPAPTGHAMARSVVDTPGTEHHQAVVAHVFGTIPVYLIAGKEKARARSPGIERS